MATTVNCCATQLIDSDGSFKVTELDNFIKSSNMACNLSYAVVAIMGSQSSGKSTLMNHLFGTDFKQMNPKKISQTTKGIWIAKCNGIEQCTIAMDLEGTDGRERGEDDTNFEKQSALFALAVSDVVLINMWCNNVGNVQAGGKPLLKTVFQAMMRLFSPRKTTLLFVLRDKTETPLKNLEPTLREDIQKIWDGIKKPQARVDTPLSEFFNVEVIALSHYYYEKNKFEEEVAELRKRFNNSIEPGGLAADRRGAVPASGFSASAQGIWNAIRENKDLDLPAHKVMVATVRCDNIADEKLSQLRSDKGWLKLEEAVQSGPVQGFGEMLSSIIDTCLSLYDDETIFFDENVRNAKREQLKSNALHLVYPAYTTMIGHLRSKALEDFKTKLDQSLNNGEGFASSVQTWKQSILLEFGKGSDDASVRQAKWGASKVRDKLCRDIDSYALAVRDAKLLEITTNFEKQLEKALAKPVKFLFEAREKDTWFSIRIFLKRETEKTKSKFSDCVDGFELEKETVEKMKQSLEDHAKKLVEKIAREVAEADGNVVSLMKNRFSTVFNLDNKSLPRDWTTKLDIGDIKKKAQQESLKLLSDMAAIRLDENKTDTIESVLSLWLINKTSADSTTEDPLNSSTWDEFSLGDILISPVDCKILWNEFNVKIQETVMAATAYQTAYKQQNSRIKHLGLGLQAANTALTTAAVGMNINSQVDHDSHDHDNHDDSDRIQ